MKDKEIKSALSKNILLLSVFICDKNLINLFCLTTYDLLTRRRIISDSSLLPVRGEKLNVSLSSSFRSRRTILKAPPLR